MRRVLIYDRFDAQVCELSENDVFELTRHEVVNGEHELSITTTQVLEKGQRVLMEDDRGYWHEWVVSGIDELHANGSRPYGSYYCVWSVQPDLMGTRVSAMPGVQTPTTAALALDAALGGTTRWARGTVTNTNTGGASMYDTDGWNAMSILVANWGGEVDTTIEVSSKGVVSRLVDLYAQQGEQDAKRRFDFGADLVSIRRTMTDEPLYCRLTPRGMGEPTEGGGYGRKITIESVNDGKDYLVCDDMVDLAKLPDGNGGWEYPTLEVENSDCETPSDLLAWAQSVLNDFIIPKITYEIDVVQAAKEGIDLQGVSLGDAVHVVDGKFNDLRLSGRVMEITTDEIAHTATSITIGNVGAGISQRFNDLYDGVKTAEQSVTQLAQSLATADYIDNLLDRINAEINATGGYAYIVPGHGILTFDVAVADPLNPVEASRVVEIKGGSIRIANTKTAQGQWEWKTVFTSGHIAGELVTAAQITTGYIGNSSSGTYIDLDNNTVKLGANSSINATIDNTGFDIKNSSNSAMFFGYQSPSYKLRIGGSGTNDDRIILDSRGSIDLFNGVSTGAHIGYDQSISKYYTTIGTRVSGSTIGAYSSAYGANCTASGERSFSSGQYTTASGTNSTAMGNSTTASSYASMAVGTSTKASGDSSFACGSGTTASGQYSFAAGQGTTASGTVQMAIGKYNATNSSHPFIIGYGNSTSDRKSIMTVSYGGNVTITGVLTQGSDRRLKTHIAYLGDDACRFVKRLKPAVYVKDGGRHYGFYAQDVQSADVWDTKTVEAQHIDESLDFDPLTLDYTALIAPLTAYAQSLEKRVESLETRLSELEEKIGKE